MMRYKDDTLTPGERAEDLLARLSLDVCNTGSRADDGVVELYLSMVTE